MRDRDEIRGSILHLDGCADLLGINELKINIGLKLLHSEWVIPLPRLPSLSRAASPDTEPGRVLVLPFSNDGSQTIQVAGPAESGLLRHAEITISDSVRVNPS